MALITIFSKDRRRNMEYVLACDSTADIPVDVLKQLDTKVLPFSYSIGDDIIYYYLDERDGDIADFYAKLKGGAMPVTS